MNFKIEHNCIYVTDMNRTIDFYYKALQLSVYRQKQASGREIIFLKGAHSEQQIEIIKMSHRSEPYQLGENPTHIAFRTDDIEAARELHKQIGCFSHELPEFGVYFIKDPDGYISEIMPTR